MNEDKADMACSPRRKIKEAREQDRKAAEFLDTAADSKDGPDDRADSKDAKFDAKGTEQQRSIAEFSFSFIKNIIGTTTPTNR